MKRDMVRTWGEKDHEHLQWPRHRADLPHVPAASAGRPAGCGCWIAYCAAHSRAHRPLPPRTSAAQAGPSPHSRTAACRDGERFSE
jgi:hypothetical protein